MQGSHRKGGKRGAGFTSTRGKGGGEIEHTGKIACPAIRFCRVKLFKWPDQSHGEGGGDTTFLDWIQIVWCVRDPLPSFLEDLALCVSPPPLTPSPPNHQSHQQVLSRILACSFCLITEQKQRLSTF